MIVRKSLLVLCVAVAVTACTPTTDGGDAPALPPLDAATAQQDALAQFPGATAFALYDARGKGFRFFADGGVEYISFGARTDLRTRTRTTSMTGNTICLAEADGWSGACLDLYGALSGPIRVNVAFGNGASRSYQTSLAVETD